MKKLYLALILLIVLSGCRKDHPQIAKEVPELNDSPQFLSFVFESATNGSTFSGNDTLEINKNEITGAVSTTGAKKLIPTFLTTAGAKVTVNGQVQISGKTPEDFSEPVTYELSYKNGQTSKYVVNLSALHGIPILYIETDNAERVVSKEDYLNGHLNVNGNKLFVSGMYDGEIKIRGRGNTTWGKPKKPYKLKLPKKAELLGMPASKDWVLLANYFDKSLLRNSVAFELGTRFSMAYTPRSQMIDLILNSRYEGTYLLTESIKIDKDRVNITELSEGDVSGDAVTGGYLLEVNERLDEAVNFRTIRYGVAISFKEPELPNSEQLNYIKKYVERLETALSTDKLSDPVNGYAKYINTSSFVDFFIINEIMKNHDADFQGSVYLYKDRNDKMSIGPIWDFDIAAGNINYDGAEKVDGWRINKNKWYKRLFEDAEFRKMVKDRWNSLKTSKIENIDQFIDKQVKYIDKSQKANFGRWDILNKFIWPNAEVAGSYQGEIVYLKKWLNQRIAWMDSELNNGKY